jgi:hypothetical protein
MKTLLAVIALSMSLPVAAQTPKGDYPDIGFGLIPANHTSPIPPPRVFASTEITCALLTNSPPATAAPNTFFLTWFDPLNPGLYCQADMTRDVQQLEPGMWYASLTFFLPAGKWDPCPEYVTNGGCWAKTLDGRRYQTYDLPSHETPAFAVGVFLRPPTNLTIKAHDDEP